MYIDAFFTERPPNSRICNPVLVRGNGQREIWHQLIEIKELDNADESKVYSFERLSNDFKRGAGLARHTFGRSIRKRPVIKDDELG